MPFPFLFPFPFPVVPFLFHYFQKRPPPKCFLNNCLLYITCIPVSLFFSRYVQNRIPQKCISNCCGPNVNVMLIRMSLLPCNALPLPLPRCLFPLALFAFYVAIITLLLLLFFCNRCLKRNALNLFLWSACLLPCLAQPIPLPLPLFVEINFSPSPSSHRLLSVR